MIAQKVQARIDAHVDTYFQKIVSGEWPLSHAHHVLLNPDQYNLDIFQIGALATAIAICQTADSEGLDY